MKFEFATKSLEYDGSGTASATKVILNNAEGAHVPIFLSPEKIDLSNAELLELALEVIYQENFPMRAENEKFNVLGERIARFDQMIENATGTIVKMEEQVALSAASRSAFLQVVMVLYGKGLLSDENLLQTGLFDDENDEETLETI